MFTYRELRLLLPGERHSYHRWLYDSLAVYMNETRQRQFVGNHAELRRVSDLKNDADIAAILQSLEENGLIEIISCKARSGKSPTYTLVLMPSRPVLDAAE